MDTSLKARYYKMVLFDHSYGINACFPKDEVMNSKVKKFRK